MTPADIRSLPDAKLAAMARNLPDATLLRIASGFPRPQDPRRATAESWAQSQLGAWKPSQLASAASVSRQAATAWIDDLVRRGAVLRVAHGLYQSAGAA